MNTANLTLVLALFVALSPMSCKVGTWDIPKTSTIPCESQQDCPSGWNCDETIGFCATGCEIVNAPSELTVTITGGQIVLSWPEAKTNAAGLAIEVEDGTVVTTLPISKDARSAVHDAAQPNQTYRYRLHAVRDACTSDWTDWVTVTSSCGDGKWGPGEACDDGPANSATCNYASGTGSFACTESACGDGYTNEGAGEDCDEGRADTATCNYAGAPAGMRARSPAAATAI